MALWERHVRCEVPYNLAQKTETKLCASQSQQRLWQLVNVARATTANYAVQLQFLSHWLQAMAPIIKGTHGVQRSQREASAMGDIYHPAFLAGVLPVVGKSGGCCFPAFFAVGAVTGLHWAVELDSSVTYTYQEFFFIGSCMGLCVG